MENLKYSILGLCLLLCCSCAQTRRLERSGTQAVLSLVTRQAEKPKEAYRPNWTKVKNPLTQDSLYFGEGIIDSAGQRHMLVRLEPIEVVARRKTVIERLGRVMIGFRVEVPEELQSRSFGIRLTPVLHKQDTSFALDALLIRGGLYAGVQSREAWQFDKYRRIVAATGGGDSSVRIERARRLLAHIPQQADPRLDSVVRSPRRVEYFYSQEVPATGSDGELRVTLQGEVQALDGSRYRLPASDTMRYAVSSMLSFVDTTQRFLTRIVRKYAEVRDRTSLGFPPGGTAIIDTLGDNARSLAHILSTMEGLMRHDEYYVDSVTLTATGSPEGLYAGNERLARMRAEALKAFLRDRFGEGIDTLVALRWVAEDWNGLRGAILREDSLSHKAEMLRMIAEGRDDPDALEKNIRNEYPQEYARIRRRLYPQLRAVDFRYSLRRKEMVRDTVVTAEPDTLYARAVTMLRERDYAGAMYLLESYRDRNYALALLSRGYDAEAYEVLKALPQGAQRDYLTAIVCSRLGRRDEALEHYRRAAEEEPRYRFRAKLDPELSELINLLTDE